MKDSEEKKIKKAAPKKTVKKEETKKSVSTKKNISVKKIEEKKTVAKKKREASEKEVSKKTSMKKNTAKVAIKETEPVKRVSPKKAIEKMEKVEEKKIVSNKTQLEPIPVKNLIPKEVKKENPVGPSKEHSELIKKESSIKIEKKNINRFGLTEVIVLVIITCIVSIIMGILIAKSLFSFDNSSYNNFSPELSEFIENYDYIKETYGDEVNEKELLNGALSGLLEAVGDPYASFIDQEDRLNQELAGGFYGVGLEITNNKEGNIEVYNVFENGPAFKANIQKGDIILSVNDLDLKNKSIKVFSTYVQNEEVQEYVIRFSHDGEEKEATLKREYITIPSVFSKTYEQNGKKVGYLQVTIFSGTTYRQFKTELEKLEAEKIDSLIIDVRNNSGGSLDTVVNMLSLFLDSNHVIYQTDLKGEIEKFYSDGQETKKYPISILVNGSSASASEILASALQEEYGATLVGTNTFGKGTVQQVKTLQNGGKYKVTTKKWLTPSGKWVGEKPLEPNYVVLLGEEYSKNPSDETDNQLQKALELLTK